MKTKIILSLMTFVLLLAACGKHEQPAKKAASKSGTTAAIPAILNQATINPVDVFTASRNGEQVTIRWNIDFSACKGIKISRNTTGKGQKETIAKIPATSKEYVDSVPDTRSYWYWIDISLSDGNHKSIGPMRVPPDVNNTGNYAEASNDMRVIIQRTENAVVIAWDLPANKYKVILIRRSSNPDYHVKRNPRKDILRTRDWHGDLVDRLPDPDADYWYWIEATREDGSVLSAGPIKAEFTRK